MGLASVIENAVAIAADAIDDIKVPATYRRTDVSPSYDFTTGAVTNAPTTVELTKVVELTRSALDIQDLPIEEGLRRFMILDKLAFEPKTMDEITVKGEAYRIEKVMQVDPLRYIWYVDGSKLAPRLNPT